MNGQERDFNELFEQALSHDVYWEEWLVRDFVEELSQRIEALGMSRSVFAERIKSSPAYVTKILRGDGNLTVASMAKLARAVKSVVRIHLAPVGASTRWIDVMNSEESDTIVNSDNKVGYVEFGTRQTLDGHVMLGGQQAAVSNM